MDIAAKNLSASLEDYLEAIFHIAAETGIARSKEIAERLGVAKSSVTGALRLLAHKGLVNYKPYGLVNLTEDGCAAAKAIAGKHEVIHAFFVDVLGVEPGAASRAACAAEHALGSQIVDKLYTFIEYARAQELDGRKLVHDFKKYQSEKTKAGGAQESGWLKE